MKFRGNQIKEGLHSGAQKGWSGFTWMLKILIPVSFFTALLEYSGLLVHVDFILAPLMGLLELPAMAALPIVVGLLTGIYGGIAAMVMLPLSIEQMTLIAIFILISHNMIQEGIIQGKSGLHPLKATLCRLLASVVTVLVVAWFFKPVSTIPAGIGISGAIAPASFGAMLWTWTAAMFYLSIQIFLIIMTLMMLLGVMKSLNLIPWLVKALAPLLKTMGLNERVGILWLTAVVFGIAYGAAVIVEEARESHLSAVELERLHLSIGINHSMVEDPALFLPLGLSAFWLWVPRLITAILAVHLFDLWQRISRKPVTESAKNIR